MQQFVKQRRYLLVSALAAGISLSTLGAAMGDNAATRKEISLREEASQVLFNLRDAEKWHAHYGNVIDQYLRDPTRVTFQEMDYARQLQKRINPVISNYSSRLRELNASIASFENSRVQRMEAERRQAESDHYAKQPQASLGYKLEREVLDWAGERRDEWNEVKQSVKQFDLDNAFDEDANSEPSGKTRIPNTFFSLPRQESFEGSEAERNLTKLGTPKFREATEISPHQRIWAEEAALLPRVEPQAQTDANRNYMSLTDQIQRDVYLQQQSGISGQTDRFESGIVNPHGENPWVPDATPPAQPARGGQWQDIEPHEGHYPGWGDPKPRSWPGPGFQDLGDDSASVEPQQPQQFGRAYLQQSGSGDGGNQAGGDASSGQHNQSASGYRQYGAAYGNDGSEPAQFEATGVAPPDYSHLELKNGSGSGYEGGGGGGGDYGSAYRNNSGNGGSGGGGTGNGGYDPRRQADYSDQPWNDPNQYDAGGNPIDQGGQNHNSGGGHDLQQQAAYGNGIQNGATRYDSYGYAVEPGEIGYEKAHVQKPGTVGPHTRYDDYGYTVEPGDIGYDKAHVQKPGTVGPHTRFDAYGYPVEPGEIGYDRAYEQQQGGDQQQTAYGNGYQQGSSQFDANGNPVLPGDPNYGNGGQDPQLPVDPGQHDPQGSGLPYDPYAHYLTRSDPNQDPPDPYDPYGSQGDIEDDGLGGVSADVRPNIVDGKGMSSLRDRIMILTK